MKKIVGIIAALALVSAVFAKDMPQNVTPSVTTWGGKASLEYQIDLDKKAFGMANAESADFEIQFVSEKEEGCTGDGIWGELKVKVAGVKVKDADAFTVPAAAVTTAVIHILEGDFFVDMNIKAPGLATSGKDIDIATWSPKSCPTGKVELKDKTAGFTMNFGLKDTIVFNLQVADNGVVTKDAKAFGFLFDATLKAVENLDFYAGAAFATQNKQFAASTRVDYKLGIGDSMYLKPAVGFALGADKSKTLNAGVLFGCGDAKREPGFAKFADGLDNVCNNCWDGVSVYSGIDLDKKTIEFLAGLYDQTFVPGLKFGAQFYVKDIAKFGDGNWAADVAAKYENTFSDWTISANFGVEIEKISSVETGFLWGAGIKNASIIDNTTLYVNYSGMQAEKIKSIKDNTVTGKNEKGTIKIGAEIAF